MYFLISLFLQFSRWISDELLVLKNEKHIWNFQVYLDDEFRMN